MPGNQNPLGRAKSAETKVVRQVAPSRTQCYISKAYKIPQNCGCDSPFFGSVLTELIYRNWGGERAPLYGLLFVMLPTLPMLEFEISLFQSSVSNDGVPQFVSTSDEKRR